MPTKLDVVIKGMGNSLGKNGVGVIIIVVSLRCLTFVMPRRLSGEISNRKMDIQVWDAEKRTQLDINLENISICEV